MAGKEMGFGLIRGKERNGNTINEALHRMPEVNTKCTPTNLSIKKIPHILILRLPRVPQRTEHRASQYLPDLPAIDNLFDFPNGRGERALDPNECFRIVRFCEGGHLAGHGDVPLEWPFDEDFFPGEDAGPDGGEVPVYARAADYHVDL